MLHPHLLVHQRVPYNGFFATKFENNAFKVDQLKENEVCQISGSHSGEYEDEIVLGYSAV
jgi:hypothetical protein